MMMFNGIRHGLNDTGMSPLPGINTVLSHREDIDSLMQWAPTMPVFGSPESGLFSDLLESANNNHLDTFPEMWEAVRKEEDCLLPLRGNLPADEGRIKVEKSAAQLGINIDPVSWTREDVLKWLRHSMRCNHSSPGMIVEEDWRVDGKDLCEMSSEAFTCRLPKDGDILHSELQLWKTVFEVQIMAGYNPMSSTMGGMFSEDYAKDSMFSASTYAVLESAEAFPNANHMVDPKYMVTPPNLLQADPNLQQVTGSCGQAAFDSRLTSYCEYNNNNNNNTSNNNNNNRDLMYSIVKAEQTEDTPSNADDSSWLMHNSVTSSTPFYQEHKPKLNGRKWQLNRVGSDGVSSAMCDVATVTHRRGKRTITLWLFLKELLVSHFPDPAPIRWLDREKGIFKIEDSVRVAKLWGERKNRPAMNYDKLSRSIRQYYKKGIIKKTSNSKRLVYQFCPEFL